MKKKYKAGIAIAVGISPLGIDCGAVATYQRSKYLEKH